MTSKVSVGDIVEWPSGRCAIVERVDDFEKAFYYGVYPYEREAQAAVIVRKSNKNRQREANARKDNNEDTSGLARKEETEMSSGGGKKNDQGKEPVSLIPAEFILGIAKVFEFGGRKYGLHNFRQGIDHSRCVDAFMRHALAILRGEEIDQESGLPHTYHAGCSLAMYDYMRLHYPERCDIFEVNKGKGVDNVIGKTDKEVPGLKAPDVVGVNDEVRTGSTALSEPKAFIYTIDTSEIPPNTSRIGLQTVRNQDGDGTSG